MDLTRTTRTMDVDGEEESEEEALPKVFLGQVPIMLRSMYCILSDSNDRELTDLGECPYDQGGYFVINGSEKVLIAQEKMTNNAVYVFAKKQPSKYSHVAELKSCLDASRPASSMHVRLLTRNSVKGVNGSPIHCTLPYIRQEVPVVVVFRALGFVADRDILEHIVYDFSDTQLMEMVRPSLEEAFVIQNRAVALDYIGKRGSTQGVLRDKRILYARQVLQKEMLPHVGVGEYCETKKVFPHSRMPSGGPFPPSPRHSNRLRLYSPPKPLRDRHTSWVTSCTNCLCPRWAHADPTTATTTPRSGWTWQARCSASSSDSSSASSPRTCKSTARSASTRARSSVRWRLSGTRRSPTVSSTRWRRETGGSRARRLGRCGRESHKCSTGSPLPRRSHTCGGSTRPSAERASWPSRASCTTPTGGWCVLRRRPRARQ